MSKIKHNEMVANLAKNGQDIIDEITPNSAHLLHMSVGIAGEAGELFEAFQPDSPSRIDREHVIEELGDMEFYIEGYRQGTGLTREGILAHKLTVNTQLPSMKLIGAELMYHSTNLLDSTKKVAIYCKMIDIEVTANNLRNIEYCLDLIRSLMNVNYEECIRHNINKLATGKKARYKDGVFTNKQAQVRRDKDESDETA